MEERINYSQVVDSQSQVDSSNTTVSSDTTSSYVKHSGRRVRRGQITFWGEAVPKRPFNNKANTSKRKGVHSRKTNELKKKIYGQIK